MKKKVVFVGLSGGVDSAVSAALLVQQGYDVVGIFIKTWHPEFIECNEEDERRDAMRNAAHLDIPFLTLDLEQVYKNDVADYMISEYKKGRTPNPDVMCNKYVKFGGFLDFAISKGADYVATGHYANTADFPFGKVLGFPRKNLPTAVKARPDHSQKENPPLKNLLRSPDPSKDQSYFLWTLNQKQLSKIIFPIGNLKKTEVRKLAKKFKLPVAEKHDSQGICFLGAVDLKDFLKHYINEKKGAVQNERGEVIGHHEGVVFHTLGERHGFVITQKSANDAPYYVVGKNLEKNILTVSQEKNSQKLNNKSNYELESTNWIAEIPNEEKKYVAQIRYHGEYLPCKVKGSEIIFENPVRVASGQSIVVYDGDVCLGGGVVV